MHTPLRVIQLVLSLVFGGTEKLVYDIVQRIDKLRVSPVICCFDKLGHFGEELQHHGYPIYLLNRKSGIDWGLVKRINGVIQQERIDVIHAHQYTPYFYGLMASLYSRLIQAEQKPRLIFTEHGRFYPDQRKIKRVLINPILSRFTDEIVTISESTKESLIKYENFPAHKIKVIYNGIDLKQFSHVGDPLTKKRELGLQPHYNVIGIVARLDPIKNHPILLQAFEQILQHLPETYLIIVGDGPEEERLRNIVQSRDLTDKVRFLGARSDISELLHVFDIFALSSFSEGTSVTLLEAMGAGLPIVATRVGGNPEVVREHETGFLVESNNAEEMANMLIKLLQDTKMRHKMGLAGKKWVEINFSLDLMVKAYTDLYFKVAR
ncbi:glycosyl transferase, group 1 [Candidatus Vecturithrix granuli]|uniref:Glycosyl transferase, group 1 n=1 Tax=Vecturithrix granuli TaxID=1499967 RepID=A0A081C4C1_VECG1|nr:glycosyl transferase, group 1 [Candidatus Vecturithrix granuli]